MIDFCDTRKMIEAMLNADKTQPASIGLRHAHVGNAFCRKLDALGFRGPGYRRVVLDLHPDLPHGHVQHVDGSKSDNTVWFNAGLDAHKFAAMPENERSKAFVSLTTEALGWLATRDHLDVDKIEKAKEFVTALTVEAT